MDKKVSLLYFSATGTTAKVVKEVSKGIVDIVSEYDITLPYNRRKDLIFDNNDLVIVGIPVYAGRVPGFLADYFSKIKGNNTKAVFIVVYGICAKHCPMGAIRFNNYKDIDSSKCIKCCSCIKGCPVEAKAITDETLINFTQMLINNFSKVRHEPEFFI